MKDDLHYQIAKVAYDLHEKRGLKHGSDLQDWLEAERIVSAHTEKRAEKEKPKKSSKAAIRKRK